MNARCNCPPSFRYHAMNCPFSPDAVLNLRFHKKCLSEEARLERFKRLSAKGMAAVLSRRLGLGNAQ